MKLEKKTIDQSENYLSQLLATTYLLYLKTQNYHWNVEGPEFYELHKLFQEQYEEMNEAIDEIAERIRKIERFAPATTHEFQKLSRISENIEAKTATEKISTLLKDHEICISLLRKGIKAFEEGEDQGTIDLFLQRLRAHEKTAWMLRSTLAN